ncbi:MAG: inorganic phosphate transporter [Candidatus Dasytiphilus stammeri]
MLNVFASLEYQTLLLLVLALVFVLSYEMINGFHDTATAVVTVIYTRALHSSIAVLMAGLLNFLGVILGGLSVAYAIVHLLPTDLLINVSSGHGLDMIFSMLLAAIICNLVTWYLKLPSSSSHTLIGAILGIGITNAWIKGLPVIKALNLSQISKILISLIISPVIGILVAGQLIYLLRWYGKSHLIHLTPVEFEKTTGKKQPPFWIRILLIISAAGISYSHGANDGQKGVGLIMLVLISIAPTAFVIDLNASDYNIVRTRDAVNHLEYFYNKSPQKIRITDEFCEKNNVLQSVKHAKDILFKINNYKQININHRIKIRRLLMCLSDAANKLAKLPSTNYKDKYFLNVIQIDLLKTIEYAPMWIVMVVALALSLGTMIGWQRITITIGEKLCKNSMTYAQGITAQLTAALSIGIASYTGMPVSTTHVLSSSIVGAQLFDGGGVQIKTIKNIFLVWIFTFPITMLLSALIYLISIYSI